MQKLSNLKELRIGVAINFNGDPYQVIHTDFHKTSKNAPVMRTKLRNLITGQVLEHTFKSGELPETADLGRSRAQYLYKEGDEIFFMDNETFEQFSFPGDSVGDLANYVAEGTDVDVLHFEGKPVTVSLPPKVNLRVTEAPPSVKGDSANNPTKQVTVETGATFTVPIFIKQGDTIRVNTETGEYVERVTE